MWVMFSYSYRLGPGALAALWILKRLQKQDLYGYRMEIQLSIRSSEAA